MTTIQHDSDCALHNEPAMPNGPCDCDAQHDDAIDEALFDTASDGEGHLHAHYLRHHLAKQGLKIVPVKADDRQAA